MSGLTRRSAFLALCLATVTPGLAAAPLRVTDGTGTEKLLDAVIGDRPAVLHLWATWCAPCLEELPRLAALRQAHPELAAGIVVLSVDTAPYDTVAAFLREELDLSLPTLKVTSGNPGLTFALRGYPSTLFLAADRTVRDRQTGSLDWTSPATVERLRRHLGIDPPSR